MSDFYDIANEAQTFTGSFEEYLDFLETYFNVCQNKTVLEIGPFSGDHTRKIINNNPSRIEVVEGFESAIQSLKQIPKLDKIWFGDVLQELTTQNKFDIVICFGVLYHLHSPLHLIELIVNNCQPMYLMLDCVFEQEHITVLPEETNIAGSCQTIKNWKSCKVNIVLPFLVYKECLEKMGYELVRTHVLHIKNEAKHNSWLATWKLKETNDQSVS